MNFPRNQQALEAQPSVRWLSHFLAPCPRRHLPRPRPNALYDDVESVGAVVTVAKDTHAALKAYAKANRLKFSGLADGLLRRAIKAPKREKRAITCHAISIAKCAQVYLMAQGRSYRKVGSHLGVTWQCAQQMAMKWADVCQANGLDGYGRRPAPAPATEPQAAGVN